MDWLGYFRFWVVGCQWPWGLWGCGFCSPWILGLMGFAHRSILRLPLSRLDGYGSWGHGPPMLVRIETSGVCVCVCVCVCIFFFFLLWN